MIYTVQYKQYLQYIYTVCIGREREYKSVGDYMSKPPVVKIKNLRTIYERALGYISNNSWGLFENITSHIILNCMEIRYVWKICINLLSTVCRPVGHKNHANMSFKIYTEDRPEAPDP
jgi:hypothetical protein